MFKQLLLVFLIYSILWWIIFTIYFKIASKKKEINYGKEGLTNYITSVLYFLIYALSFLGVSGLMGNQETPELKVVGQEDDL